MFFLLLLLPYLATLMNKENDVPDTTDKAMAEIEQYLKIRKDIPKQRDYIVKHVESCPSVGYFFKKDLPNSLTPGICYLCFCRSYDQAICWKRENLRCDAAHYHHHGVGRRHSLPPSALYAITGVTIPKQPRTISKPSILDSALTAAGYEKVLQEPETFQAEKKSSFLDTALTAVDYSKLNEGGTPKKEDTFKEDTKKSSFLDSAMSAVGYSKLNEGETPKEAEEEQDKEPGLLEKAMALFGGYEKQPTVDDYLKHVQEEATEKPGFLERAISSLGYGKLPLEDETARREFPEEVAPPPSLLALAMSAAGHAKAAHEKEKKKSRKKRSPAPGFGDIFLRDATRSAFDKELGPEACKPYESSFSEGCPPVDWCIGCTVCDCDANGRWDCHILSFCDDGKSIGNLNIRQCEYGDKKRINLEKKKKLRRKEYKKRENSRHMMNDIFGHPKMRDKSAHKMGSYHTTSPKPTVQRRAVMTTKSNTEPKKRGTHGKPKKAQDRKPQRRHQVTTPKPKVSPKTRPKRRVTITRKNKRQGKILPTTVKPKRAAARRKPQSDSYKAGYLQISKRSIVANSTEPPTSTELPKPPPFMVPATPEGKAFKKELIDSISKMLAENRRIEKQRRLENEIEALHQHRKQFKNRYKRSLVKKVTLKKQQAHDSEKKVNYNKSVSVATSKRKRHDYISVIAPNLLKQKKRYKRHLIGAPENVTDIGIRHVLQNEANQSAILLPPTPTVQTYYQYRLDTTSQNTTTTLQITSTPTVTYETDKNSAKRSVSSLDLGDNYKQPPTFDLMENITTVSSNDTKPVKETEAETNKNNTHPSLTIVDSKENHTTTARVSEIITQSMGNIKEQQKQPNATELVHETTSPLPEITISVVPKQTNEIKAGVPNSNLLDIKQSATDFWNANTTMPSNIIKTTVVNNYTTILFNLPDLKPVITRKKIGKKMGGVYKKHKMKKIIQTLRNKAWRDEKIDLYKTPEVIITTNLMRPAKNKTNTVNEIKNFFKKVIQKFHDRSNSSTQHKTKGNRILKFLQKYVRKMSQPHKHHSQKQILKIDTNKALDRQRIIETLCETFGPCKNDTLRTMKLQKRIDELYEKTYEMFDNIKTIKSLLHSINLNKYENNELDQEDDPTNLRDEVRKLQSILKNTYMEENDIEKLTNTQQILIDHIKTKVKTFIKSAGKFANILNEIVEKVSLKPQNNKKRNLRQTNVKNVNVSSTLQPPLAKLKDLLIKFNMIQNVFMKKIFNAVINLNPKDKVDQSNTYRKENEAEEHKPNNKPEAIQVYAKNIIRNLRKLKHLAQTFNTDNDNKDTSYTVRRKRDLGDADDSMEYLLMLMEYLLKRNRQLDVPANDGIDLIIEAIKNAPDIKPIKKKILIDAITPSSTTTQSTKYASKNLEGLRKYNDSDISDSKNIINSYTRAYKQHQKDKESNLNNINSQDQPLEEREDIDEEDKDMLTGTTTTESTSTEPYDFSKDDLEQDLNSKIHGMPESPEFLFTSEVATIDRSFSKNLKNGLVSGNLISDDIEETLPSGINRYYKQTDQKIISEDNIITSEKDGKHVQQTNINTSIRPHFTQEKSEVMTTDHSFLDQKDSEKRNNVRVSNNLRNDDLEDNNRYFKQEEPKFIREDDITSEKDGKRVQQINTNTSIRPYHTQQDAALTDTDVTTTENIENGPKDLFPTRTTINSGTHRKYKKYQNKDDTLIQDNGNYIHKEIEDIYTDSPFMEDDRKNEIDFEKSPNKIDNDEHRTIEIIDGDMDEDNLHGFSTLSYYLESITESTTKINTNSSYNMRYFASDDVSDSQHERMSQPDWLDQKFAEEIRTQTQFMTKNTTKLNLKQKNVVKDVKTIESGSGITKEDEDTRQRRIDKEDVIYQKEVDFLNSLDYGPEKEGKDEDRSDSKEEIDDKYAGDALSPFFE